MLKAASPEPEDFTCLHEPYVPVRLSNLESFSLLPLTRISL